MALDPSGHDRVHVLTRWHETTSILAYIRAVRYCTLRGQKDLEPFESRFSMKN